MIRGFVIEAVLVAVYGQLLVPGRPVEYVMPYSTIQELYELMESNESIMPEPDDDAHVKKKIAELIAFFENPLNKKKVERAFQAPWRKSPPMIVNERVSFVVVNTMENAEYGEGFDPIETELILTSIRENLPMLTDQYELTDKIIAAEIPVQVFDVDDFDFAVEDHSIN